MTQKDRVQGSGLDFCDSQMESVSPPKCGSRLSAARNRFKPLPELHGLRTGRFHNMALALAPRTF
eukprot:3025445-Pyramimonas_sp.AAC.1